MKSRYSNSAVAKKNIIFKVFIAPKFDIFQNIMFLTQNSSVTVIEQTFIYFDSITWKNYVLRVFTSYGKSGKNYPQNFLSLLCINENLNDNDFQLYEYFMYI